MKKTYVQYGCGHSAPKNWINYDASPTLQIQKVPILGYILKSQLNTTFPSNVKHGDIIKGLPLPENSCDGVYCSHTLEHLSLTDLRIALKNTFKILKPGGIFRCVLPDLELCATRYLKSLEKGERDACLIFMRNTLLGLEERPKNIKAFFSSFFGNSHHLWMWDFLSLSQELKNVGFKNIRSCMFNDSHDEMFQVVEDEGRFIDALSIECIK